MGGCVSCVFKLQLGFQFQFAWHASWFQFVFLLHFFSFFRIFCLSWFCIFVIFCFRDFWFRAFCRDVRFHVFGFVILSLRVVCDLFSWLLFRDFCFFFRYFMCAPIFWGVMSHSICEHSWTLCLCVVHVVWRSSTCLCARCCCCWMVNHSKRIIVLEGLTYPSEFAFRWFSLVNVCFCFTPNETCHLSSEKRWPLKTGCWFSSGKETNSETNSWNSSRISTKKDTTSTVNLGNRRGFCLWIQFFSFFSFFHWFHFFFFLKFSFFFHLFFIFFNFSFSFIFCHFLCICWVLKICFFWGLNFVTISLDSSDVKNQFLGTSRVYFPPFGPSFPFFSYFFLFLSFFLLFIFSFFSFFVHFFISWIFQCFSFSFFHFFRRKSFSSLYFFQICFIAGVSIRI